MQPYIGAARWLRWQRCVQHGCSTATAGARRSRVETSCRRRSRSPPADGLGGRSDRARRTSSTGVVEAEPYSSREESHVPPDAFAVLDQLAGSTSSSSYDHDEGHTDSDGARRTPGAERTAALAVGSVSLARVPLRYEVGRARALAHRRRRWGTKSESKHRVPGLTLGSGLIWEGRHAHTR